MTLVRLILSSAILAGVPAMAWAQTTTTTTEVSRVEDLVCSEPVNQVATCVDREGRILTRVDDVSPTTTTTTTTTVVGVPPAQRSGPVPLALTG